MNNTVKVIVGSILGMGIGAAISKAIERQTTQDTIAIASGEGPRRESLRERWERARQAGEEAKAAREAELIAYFRQKTHDPDAMLGNPAVRDEG